MAPAKSVGIRQRNRGGSPFHFGEPDAIKSGRTFFGNADPDLGRADGEVGSYHRIPRTVPIVVANHAPIGFAYDQRDVLTGSPEQMKPKKSGIRSEYVIGYLGDPPSAPTVNRTCWHLAEGRAFDDPGVGVESSV